MMPLIDQRDGEALLAQIERGPPAERAGAADDDFRCEGTLSGEEPVGRERQRANAGARGREKPATIHFRAAWSCVLELNDDGISNPLRYSRVSSLSACLSSTNFSDLPSKIS